MSLLKSILFKRSPKDKDDNNNHNDNNNNRFSSNFDRDLDPSIQSTQSYPVGAHSQQQRIILNNYPPNYITSLQSNYSDPNFSQYQNQYQHQKSKSTHNKKRRTISNADFYNEHEKRTNKHKKHTRKTSKTPRKRKKRNTNANTSTSTSTSTSTAAIVNSFTNFYYNGTDDNDDADIYNSSLPIYDHHKSGTMVIKPTLFELEDDSNDYGNSNDIFNYTPSLPSLPSAPLSPQNWHIHVPRESSTSNGRLYMARAHPIHTSSSSGNYTTYSNNYSDFFSQRPKLPLLNHSIPVAKEEMQSIMKKKQLKLMKQAEEEFQNLINIIVQQLKYDHANHSNMYVFVCIFVMLSDMNHSVLFLPLC